MNDIDELADAASHAKPQHARKMHHYLPGDAETTSTFGLWLALPALIVTLIICIGKVLMPFLFMLGLFGLLVSATAGIQMQEQGKSDYRPFIIGLSSFAVMILSWAYGAL